MKIARRTMRAEVPSVAMGDIAFNLLIFFFILANSQDDSKVRWEPAETRKVEQIGHSPVHLAVDDEGKIYLNGNQIGMSRVQGDVEALLGNAPVGQRKVFLKIHKETTASIFEGLIEAVSQAGGELVHVLKEEQPGS